MRRLPQSELDARNQRLKRAMDLSMKHSYLSKEMQVRPSPFLGPPGSPLPSERIGARRVTQSSPLNATLSWPGSSLSGGLSASYVPQPSPSRIWTFRLLHLGRMTVHIFNVSLQHGLKHVAYRILGTLPLAQGMRKPALWSITF